MHFKLITYNIWHGKHIDQVIGFLKAETADVVCLQEVATTGHSQRADERVNLFETIKRALGMEGEYRRMFLGDKGLGVFDMGVAVLSTYQIRDLVVFNYERPLTDEVIEPTVKDRYWLPRVLLGTQLAIGAEHLWVFTTHFTITRNAGVSQRQKESAREVKQFLTTYDEYLLCGDMNTPYGNETYKILSEGLKDVSNPEEPTLHPTMHRVGDKKLHVDYVFLKGVKVTPVSTQIPIVDARDHLPIVVTVSTQEKQDQHGI